MATSDSLLLKNVVKVLLIAEVTFVVKLVLLEYRAIGKFEYHEGYDS